MKENSNGNTEQTKRCTKCGEVKPYEMFHKRKNVKTGRRSTCKACRRAKRQANKEKLSEKKKVWYQANKEAILKKHKDYYEANKEAIAEKRKAYYEANKEAIAEYLKGWYQANKEVISERHKAYKEANRPLMNELKAAREAKKKKNTPKFIRDCPVDKQRRAFAYNLSRLLTEKTGVQHHVDHMWPISDGGPHWSGNLQVIPAVDNLSKKDKVDEEIKKTIKEGLEYARRESKG